jgi:hypothetical protein
MAAMLTPAASAHVDLDISTSRLTKRPHDFNFNFKNVDWCVWFS